MQVAALRAIEKAESLDDPARVLAWLYRIHRNLIIDNYRKRASEQRHVDAPVLEQLVGEDMRGRALPRPQVRIDRPKALDGVIEPKHLKTLSRDAELLLLPCFLKAMGQLGSQRAALVLEAHFDAEGNPRDAAVAVDAAGSRALDGCATERLEMLRVGPLPRPGSVRLNAYFDRR